MFIENKVDENAICMNGREHGNRIGLFNASFPQAYVGFHSGRKIRNELTAEIFSVTKMKSPLKLDRLFGASLTEYRLLGDYLRETNLNAGSLWFAKNCTRTWV